MKDSYAADISFYFYSLAGGEGCREQESDHLFPVLSRRRLQEAAPWRQHRGASTLVLELCFAGTRLGREEASASGRQVLPPSQGRPGGQDSCAPGGEITIPGSPLGLGAQAPASGYLSAWNLALMQPTSWRQGRPPPGRQAASLTLCLTFGGLLGTIQRLDFIKWGVSCLCIKGRQHVSAQPVFVGATWPYMF